MFLSLVTTHERMGRNASSILLQFRKLLAVTTASALVLTSLPLQAWALRAPATEESPARQQVEKTLLLINRDHPPTEEEVATLTDAARTEFSPGSLVVVCRDGRTSDARGGQDSGANGGAGLR